MKNIRTFLKHNLRRILIVEVILLATTFSFTLFESLYVSANPFLDSYCSENTIGEITFSIIRIIKIILSFFFPILFIAQVILIKRLNLNNLINKIICGILVVLYFLNSFWIVESYFKPARYIEHVIRDTQFPDTYSSDTLNIKDYKIHNESGIWNYKLDYDYIHVAISKVVDVTNDSIYLMNYLPVKTIYQFQQYYYSDGKVKERGVYLNSIKIGEWTYYDREGKSTTVDEIAKDPFRHTYSKLLLMLDSDGYINVTNGEDRENVDIEYKKMSNVNNANPYWQITLKDSITTKVILFDARTGKRI